jgi:hypothetical protein
MFASDGVLMLYRDYTYTASSEAAANSPSTMMSLNTVFLPEDDLFML